MTAPRSEVSGPATEPSHAHVGAIVAMILSATGSAIQAVKLVLAVGVHYLLGNQPKSPAPPEHKTLLFWYTGVALLVFMLSFVVAFLHARRIPAGLIAALSGAGVASLAFQSPAGPPFGMRWIILGAGAVTAALGVACTVMPPKNVSRAA